MEASLPPVLYELRSAETTYTPTLPVEEAGANLVEATLQVVALSGSGTTVQVTPQYSYNDTDPNSWIDSDELFTLVDTGTTLPFNETKEFAKVGQSMRFKIVTVGASVHVDLHMYAVATQGAGLESSNALPAGSATSANQVTGNNTLSTIAAGMSTAALQTTQNANLIIIASGVNLSKVNGHNVNEPFTGVQGVKEVPATTGALSTVAASATSVTLLASNSARKNGTFFNESTATLYLALYTSASLTAYTAKVAPGGYYELPNGSTYTGVVSGIWDAATGNCRVTELT